MESVEGSGSRVKGSADDVRWGVDFNDDDGGGGGKFLRARRTERNIGRAVEKFLDSAWWIARDVVAWRMLGVMNTADWLMVPGFVSTMLFMPRGKEPIAMSWAQLKMSSAIELRPLKSSQSPYARAASKRCLGVKPCVVRIFM